MVQIAMSSALTWVVEIEVSILSTVIWESKVSGFRSETEAKEWQNHFTSLNPAGCTAKVRYTNFVPAQDEITLHIKMVVDQLMKNR